MTVPWNLLDTKVGDRVLNAAALEAILGDDAFGAYLVETAITTAGAGTLTAAALTGGQIARTGPTGAYTDTLDTAANIVTALGGYTDGQVFLIRIKNATAYVETLATASGITLAPTILTPPFSIANYFATVGGTSGSPTVTLTHMGTFPLHVSAQQSNPQSVALTTVGAGTLLAAEFNAGVTSRSGATTAFTDTTDSVANILAGVSALSNAVGTSCEWTYVNNTVAVATLAGASGVTLAAVVPAHSWAKFVITRTATSTYSFLNVGQGYFPHSGTFTALTDATPVTVADANVTPGSSIIITLKTVGGTVSPSDPYITTITPGTGFTVTNSAGDTSVYNYTILG